jgi:cell division protein FtsZ
MTLNLSMPGQDELKPRITVFGVGGAGGNAVNNMIEQELEGVEFVVANTDAQALQQSRSPAKIQIGIKVTEGLGAGARATIGAAAAEESIEQIVDHLAGAHMCFITAGMGGGTGTGAAPIIAQAARELGVLTVGVVTKPFQFEGGKRMKQADDGIEALQKVVDTLIIIPNQNLFRLANENTTFTEAFALADDVLYQGVKGVTDLMVRPGLINLDFADVRAVMDEMGKAMMGTGEAEGPDRAVQAAEKAIANPLLDEISLEGARGVLINITGGYDLTLFELDEAANKIREKVDPEANIIVGSTLDTNMEGKMRVSVVATGIDAAIKIGDMPVPRRPMSAPLTQHVSAETRIDHAAAASSVTADDAAQAPEPTLFDETAVVQQQEPTFQDAKFDPTSGADLPPAAYQPRRDIEVETSTEAFVAPQRPVTGSPSQETLERLRIAAARGKPAAAPSAEPVETEEASKPRMGGLNSLISRMTGHTEDTASERSQPLVESLKEKPPVPMSQADADQERIEIPAFLRRQAN